MCTRNWIAGLIVLAALVLAVPAGAQAAQAQVGVSSDTEPAAPETVVSRVNEALLDAMRNAETLAFQGRYDRLAPVFDAAFDFPFMSRLASGRYWRDFSPDQRDRLAEAFARMSIATYAARFDGYTGQSFEVGEATGQPRNSVLVRNRLVRPELDAVSIDYLLRNFNGSWRIIDIFLDNTVSEIATKRSEYSSILASEGFDGLMTRISDKTAELAGK